MGFEVVHLPLLETLANKWERLADEKMTNEATHRALIDINHEVREVIVRLRNINPDVANTLEKEYDKLLRLARKSGEKQCDPIVLKNYLRSNAKGLHRIRKELAGELLESARQATEQSRRTVGARYKNRVVINKASTKAKQKIEPQENKDAKREREGMIQPKPPEIFQKILWIKKYGRKHWKLVSLAIFIVLCIWILSKINLFS